MNRSAAPESAGPEQIIDPRILSHRGKNAERDAYVNDDDDGQRGKFDGRTHAVRVVDALRRCLTKVHKVAIAGSVDGGEQRLGASARR